MSFSFNEFKRCFSTSFYKNMSVKLGEMSFVKDFINDDRGDLYPIRDKSRDAIERIDGNSYVSERGYTSRFICGFFPFATYEMTFLAQDGEVGFTFLTADGEAQISVERGLSLLRA